MFGDTKQKYVRLEEYNSIIIFDDILNHSDFENFEPISAGFCYIGKESITCFGNSISLNLNSRPEDTEIATKQLFGIEAVIKLKNKS